MGERGLPGESSRGLPGVTLHEYWNARRRLSSETSGGSETENAAALQQRLARACGPSQRSAKQH
jgi:hypothetical protein